MRIRYTPRARADLVGILGYLNSKSPSGAQRVGRALKTTIELIGRFPDIGRPHEPGTRVLPAAHFPYLVYWRVAETEVQIIHIRHAARGQPDV